jgi:ElaB/YqjD/DUF883 family membrane-anchored ribosome-binding protein
MQTEMLKKTVKAGSKAIELGVEAERMKQTLAHSVEDGLLEAKRALKRGRYAAAEAFDDATYRVKQNPWRALALTLGLGFSLGALTSLLIQRAAARCGKEE